MNGLLVEQMIYQKDYSCVNLEYNRVYLDKRPYDPMSSLPLWSIQRSSNDEDVVVEHSIYVYKEFSDVIEDIFWFSSYDSDAEEYTYNT